MDDQTANLGDALSHAHPWLGWIATTLVTIWSYFLKRDSDDLRSESKQHVAQRAVLADALQSIDKRLARIEGRFEERDHGGNY